MKLQITPEVKRLINFICDIQIEALINIQTGKYQLSQEDRELLQEINLPLQRVQQEARIKILHFQDMKKEPLMLGITDNLYLSILRHILFHIEEDYEDKDAISQLWDIFFYIEKERTPQIKIVTNQINLNNNGNKKIRNRTRTGKIFKL